MSLARYIITRIATAPLLVIILLTITFIVLRVLPGNPITVILGPKANPEFVKQLEHELGLDKPLWLQYIDFLVDAFTGHFGISYRWRIPVSELIWPRVAATVELTLYSSIIAIILALVIALLSAKFKIFDRLARFYTVATYAIPVFWLGLILQLIFGVYLKWFPTSGRIDPEVLIMHPLHPITGLLTIDALIEGNWPVFINALEHLILPSITLGFVISGVMSRTLRQAMMEALFSDYVRAARARGIPEKRILINYGLRNAIIPFIIIAGLQIALLLGGAVLTESTFGWPGLGTFLVESILARDYNAVQAAIVIYAFIVVIVNTVVDIIYSLIDPRVRY
ncbi:MAG: ABC transporter permease [Crenarchaeota archaeon]|nr:ABC transporter permease [Thermoproteota archaeon]